MRKFRKTGATASSVVAIVATVTVLAVYATTGRTFELSNTPDGLQESSVEEAQAGSVATLRAVKAIFAELQLRETQRESTESSENLQNAISSLAHAQDSFEALQWKDDRAIDLVGEQPNLPHFRYFSEEVASFIYERGLPTRMSSLFVFYSTVVAALHMILVEISSPNDPLSLRKPILPRIEQQLRDLIFFGNMISEVGRITYPDS